MFRISNRVYTADAYPVVRLDLLTCPGYKPPTKRFRAGILRTRKGTILIYPNGRAVVNKCRKRNDVKKTVVLCAEITGIMLHNIKLVNISAYANLGRRLRLDQIAPTIPKAIFEPELHPGLLFYIDRVSVVVYHTGVIMCVGNKSYCQLKYVKRYISRIFNKYN